LSVCWIRPPLVRPSALGGGGAQGISKGVLAASLNDIIELAMGQPSSSASGSASGVKGVGEATTGATTAGENKLPRLETTKCESKCAAGSPTARCRAQLEVASVVRDFMFPS